MKSRNETLWTLRAGNAECCLWLALGSATIAELAVDAGASSVVSLDAAGRKELTLDLLVSRIMAAAKLHSAPCGIFTSSAIEAQTRIAQGFRFAVAGSNIALVRNGFASALRPGSNGSEERS